MSTELTHEDVRRILKIIDETQHIEELDLVCGDFRLHIRRSGDGKRPISSLADSSVPELSVRQATMDETAMPVEALKPVKESVPTGMLAICAPMLGTFYRSPSPGEKPFVEVGQQVKADDTVCLIEVMKLFNSIKAGVDGTIEEIRAENAALVEYNEVLVVIAPSKI